ncbi:hypothetical protein EJ03DRAFT_334798 [Teratosphaeria nubilosa]|uniref:Uncharacterized protein n=1 Tax=Teratosphaeria nubilosa TaxID=161662 RepID=A0A6G1LH62_9PEZI|nr:hypothetical protein EJ03DRAFT_334798 [Teratosphaeria nubilosa]
MDKHIYYLEVHHIPHPDTVNHFAYAQHTPLHMSSAGIHPVSQRGDATSGNNQTNLSGAKSHSPSLLNNYSSDEEEEEGDSTNFDCASRKLTNLSPLQQIRLMQQQSKITHGETARLYTTAAKLKFYSSYGAQAWAHMDEISRDVLLDDAEELIKGLKDTLPDVVETTEHSLDELQGIAIQPQETAGRGIEPDDHA